MNASKSTPESLDQIDVVVDALTRAAEGGEGDDVVIDFRVAGGAPDQRYKLQLTTAGRRLDTCSLRCDKSDRHQVAERQKVDLDLVSSLAQRLLGSELLSVRDEAPRFLPDTLVGIITITVGDVTRRFYFAADPDQAAVQGLTTPPAILAAADALYDVAGRVLDIDNVRP